MFWVLLAQLWFVLQWQSFSEEQAERGGVLLCRPQQHVSGIGQYVRLPSGSPSVTVPLCFLWQWFGYYKSGQAKETVPLRETPLYTEVRSAGG